MHDGPSEQVRFLHSCAIEFVAAKPRHPHAQSLVIPECRLTVVDHGNGLKPLFHHSHRPASVSAELTCLSRKIERGIE